MMLEYVPSPSNPCNVKPGSQIIKATLRHISCEHCSSRWKDLVLVHHCISASARSQMRECSLACSKSFRIAPHSTKLQFQARFHQVSHSHISGDALYAA